MKSIFLSALCLLSISLIGQSDNDKRPLSKHELGLDFQSITPGFVPKLSYNYYRTEKNILHFSGTFGFGGSGNFQNISFFAGADFWNEYRSYIGQNKKWFLSHGLTADLGFSSFNYEFAGVGTNISGTTAGIGYRLGGGYKINDRFTLTTSVNPKLNYQLLNRNSDFSNKIIFQAPLRLGINYRF